MANLSNLAARCRVVALMGLLIISMAVTEVLLGMADVILWFNRRLITKLTRMTKES
jgi:NADH:ubiquinone oxidoreductase subunit K